jgi:pyruvate formate lyase activating enzyme
MTEEMLEAFHPYLDAANVDLKAFRDETYRKYVGAKLQPALDSLRRVKRLSIWLEVTTLVIPGINDDSAELRDVARFVAGELGADTPWHISRFFPAYNMMDTPPTPLETLSRAREIGLAGGLRYVYVGNLLNQANTLCHACGRLLIRRSRFGILENHVGTDGHCPHCQTLVAGVGMEGSLATKVRLSKRKPSY